MTKPLHTDRNWLVRCNTLQLIVSGFVGSGMEDASLMDTETGCIVYTTSDVDANGLSRCKAYAKRHGFVGKSIANAIFTRQ